MEPASSSSSSDDEPPLPHARMPWKSFGELPSDDSVGISSDSSSDDERVAAQRSCGDAENSNLTLGSRIDARKSGEDNDVRVSSYRRIKGEQDKALSIASTRLGIYRRELKSRKKQKLDQPEKKPFGGTVGSEEVSSEEQATSARSENLKGRSKHCPTEASSRRSDFYRRGAPDLNSSGIGVAVGANRYKPCDPRAEGLSGHFDLDAFEKRYAFLEEIRMSEISALEKRIAARKATGKKGQKLRRKLGLSTNIGGSLEEDQMELVRLKRERSELQRSLVKRKAKQAVKKRIRNEVAEGKRGAHHLKQREIRSLELEASFEELRKRGGDGAVEKELAKKRKKKAAKDKRRHFG
mmetsp:Transcript_21689/g.44711  ORF Transcript_21689/g.44711 Transcript_21689/m.44711 type:complete len:352 (+) Transcript_21689:190-1245(+)